MLGESGVSGSLNMGEGGGFGFVVRVQMELCGFAHLSDDRAVAKMGHPGF